MSRRKKVESGEYTPAQLLVCRKCGKKSNSVELGIEAPSDCSVQTIVFGLFAQCPKCHARVDQCKVHAQFNGISNWRVVSAHVG